MFPPNTRHSRAGIPDDMLKDPIEVLTRTIYGEVRGESVRCKEAIAAVVMNRVSMAQARGGWWWGSDVIGVCLKPWQFSCWNPSNPNRTHALTATDADKKFGTCRKVARRAIGGSLIDPTGGALHYHNDTTHPPWAWNFEPSVVIGKYSFYSKLA